MQAIFVGTSDGLFKIIRTKQGWDIRSRNLAEMAVVALAIHPDQRHVILAGTRGDGLYRSDDMGQNWNRLGENLLADRIGALVFDPNDVDTVYVGTEPTALWESVDGGENWRELSSVGQFAAQHCRIKPAPDCVPYIRSIAIDKHNPNRLYLAASGAGLWRSDDGGESWRDAGDGIDLPVHCVDVGPSDGATIYATTGGGANVLNPAGPTTGRPLYRSVDGGESWQSISAGVSRRYAVPVRLHPKHAQIIYLGVAQDGPARWLDRPTRANGAILRSVDGGASWQQLEAGLPVPFVSMVECIEFDPDQAENIFVATGGTGACDIGVDKGEIFRSIDRGDNWEKLPLRLPIIFALAAQ